MRSVAAFTVTLCIGLGAQAHPASPRECSEASDFIRNAALGRDNGLSRSSYMDHLYADLELIRAVPVEMRWFVQDDDDAALLVGAAQNVFDNPKLPAEHRLAFLDQCKARSARAGRAD